MSVHDLDDLHCYARVRRAASVHIATCVIFFVSTACGGKSESPSGDPSTCNQGVCATGGQAQSGGGAGNALDSSGASTGTAAGLSQTGGTGGTGGTVVQADAASPIATGGTGGDAIQPPPPLPPGVGCGDSVCELGSGLKCCWASATDTYECAATCPSDTSTFECDDDGDCPSGTLCAWESGGLDGYVSTAPFRTTCLEPTSFDGYSLECHSNDQCADGMTCCATLTELWLPDAGVFQTLLQSATCVAPEDCPASAGAAPFCRSDADCPDRRKCVRLEDAPVSMQTCSGLADSATDAVLIDCGDTQCIKELGLVCDSRWPRPEGVSACQYRTPDWLASDLAGNELQCDEQADCASGELCLLAYNPGDPNNISTICTANPAVSDWKPLCKSSAECGDGYSCCVQFDLGGAGSYVGPSAITCWGAANCTGAGSWPRCQTDADCLGLGLGQVFCRDTNVTGVRICQ